MATWARSLKCSYPPGVRVTSGVRSISSVGAGGGGGGGGGGGFGGGGESHRREYQMCHLRSCSPWARPRTPRRSCRCSGCYYSVHGGGELVSRRAEHLRYAAGWRCRCTVCAASVAFRMVQRKHDPEPALAKDRQRSSSSARRNNKGRAQAWLTSGIPHTHARRLTWPRCGPSADAPAPHPTGNGRGRSFCVGGPSLVPSMGQRRRSLSEKVERRIRTSLRGGR